MPGFCRAFLFGGISVVAVMAAYGSALTTYAFPCGSWLASDGGLVANHVVPGVHIRCCGNGFWRFRPYGESLGKAPSNQGLLPLSFGASPRLGMPALRSCSVGPPPSAIHGRGRLTRHPCRVAHCAEPPLGLPTGQIKIKSCRRANARPVEWWEARAVHGSIVGAWLASDGVLSADQSLSDVHHPCGS